MAQFVETHMSRLSGAPPGEGYAGAEIIRASNFLGALATPKIRGSLDPDVVHLFGALRFDGSRPVVSNVVGRVGRDRFLSDFGPVYHQEPVGAVEGVWVPEAAYKPLAEQVDGLVPRGPAVKGSLIAVAAARSRYRLSRDGPRLGLLTPFYGSLRIGELPFESHDATGDPAKDSYEVTAVYALFGTAKKIRTIVTLALGDRSNRGLAFAVNDQLVARAEGNKPPHVPKPETIARRLVKAPQA